MALNAKNVSYKTIDITPGIGQVRIFRISGQRQVPVLVDEDNIIANSSDILKYLDTKFPTPKLLPDDPKQAAQANLLENWSDTTFAKVASAELLKTASTDTQLLEALLPEEIPSGLRKLVQVLPYERINKLSNLISKEESFELQTILEELSELVSVNHCIIGDSMSVADIAIAAQLSLIKFPISSGISLAGKGCKGFADNPKFNSLFKWRDQLEREIMESNSAI